MNQLENIFYIALLGLIGLLSIWLQSEVRNDEPSSIKETNKNDPDYYIENFTTTGMNEFGERAYILQAERMAHFPVEGDALFDNPHLIEFNENKAPRHTYAKSGFLAGNGEDLTLTGNVKIVQEAGFGDPGGTLNSPTVKFKLSKSAQKLFD